MLEKVWAIWITGVLQPSLPQDILLDLGLTERPAMVARALDLPAQRPDLADQVQAPGTQLVDVFDRLDRALLILGAPGAGKTTLLLSSPGTFWTGRRRTRAAHPRGLPAVVLGQQRRPLADWLVDASTSSMTCPERSAKPGSIRTRSAVLDGLDEVVPEHRAPVSRRSTAFGRSMVCCQ